MCIWLESLVTNTLHRFKTATLFVRVSALIILALSEPIKANIFIFRDGKFNCVSSFNFFPTIEVKEKKLFERIVKLLELVDAYVILKVGTWTFLEFAAD